MSLDDETPTEYFGPDARNWIHPVTGKSFRLSPADYERAEERKAQYFAGQENKDHRTGCPIERTGRCACEYLSQWDDNAETAHNKAVQLSADGTIALIDRHLQAPEIRYGEPPTGGIPQEELPPGGVLYIPEEMRENMHSSMANLSLIESATVPIKQEFGPMERAHDTINFLKDNNLPITHSFGDTGAWVDFRPDLGIHGVALTGKFPIPTEDEKLERMREQMESWRATAFLMLGTLTCILTGVIGREFGWY